MKPAQLNQVVERVLALTGKYLQHRHIALQRDLAPDLPLTLASPDELVQVFLNLVLNAADAMPEGGMLRVASRLADVGRLAVAFSDTGCGIRPEHLNRIFEPFFSTKEGSTGMGLDISNNVIKQHSGEITVESQVGKGSTFTVWLPVVIR
jgi:two-component system NtrC family sensor kinase